MALANFWASNNGCLLTAAQDTGSQWKVFCPSGHICLDTLWLSQLGLLLAPREEHAPLPQRLTVSGCQQD